MTGENDTVTISRATYDRLCDQANAWRSLGVPLQDRDPELLLLLDSPAVRDVLVQTWIDWDARRSEASGSHAISAAANWSESGPSFAALQQRRQRPGALHEEFAARHGGEYRGGRVEWSTGRPAAAREPRAA